MVGHFQEVSVTRAAFAQKTREELMGLPIKELRRLVPAIGVRGKIEQDGVLVQPGSARKTTLVEVIYTSLADERVRQATVTELTPEELEELSQAGEEYDYDSQTDLGTQAAGYVKKLVKASQDCYDRETGTWLQTGAAFIDLASTIAFDLTTKRSTVTGELLASTTVMGYKNRIRHAMALQLEQYLASRHEHPETAERYREYFGVLMGQGSAGSWTRGLVDKALLSHSISKRTRVIERQQERATVNAKVASLDRLVSHAVGVLEGLSAGDDLSPGQRWVEVVLALLTVTGRRPAEVQTRPAGGVWFDEPVETNHADMPGQTWVSWHGQLKERDRHGAGEPYDIPVPVSLGTLRNALTALERSGKVVSNPEKANKNFSTYLSSRVKGWTDYIDFVTPPLGKDGQPRRLVAKDLRSLYALRYKYLGKGAALKEVGKLLGHGEVFIHAYSLDFEYANPV
jgi:hypothetical protein